MQIGTGLQNKLLQAMAMKIPCVASELTVKGLIDGAKDVVLVAKSPEEYSNLIIKLLDDDEFRNTISLKGYNFVKMHYKWEDIIRNLEEILHNTLIKNLN